MPPKSAIRFFLTYVVFMLFYTLGMAQDKSVREKYSFSFRNVKLSEALTEIESETGVSFSYSSRKIPVGSPVSLQANDQSLDDVLTTLLAPLNVEYKNVAGKIVLKSIKPEHRKKYTISGYIKDGSDGEDLIGTTVLIRELGQGVISNAYGFYSITLPQGNYTLQFSFVGYTDVYRNVVLDRDHNVDIELAASASQLQEIVVSPGDSTRYVESVHANVMRIESETAISKPVAFGESDVVKALEIVPGVQLFRDGSTFFNVRGGDRDQNQILVDDAPLYNPAHFLGLFSSIIPEATKDIKLYRGDLPAQYGGRLSSVLDIRTRDGNMKKLSLNGSVGLVAGRLAVEGPIKKDKSSFFVSARRSYIFDLLAANNSDISSLFFSDFNAKTNIRINKRNRLFVSTYFGRDEFLTDGGIRWENNAGSIRWNHVFNDRLFLNTTLYSSTYEYKLIGGPNLIWRNNIVNASLKVDFTKYTTPDNTLRFGLRISGHNFNPGNLEDSTGNIPTGQPFVPKRNASEFSHYISKDQKIGSKLLATFGLRLSNWTNIGRTIEYEINDNYQVVDSTVYDSRDEYNSYTNLEPRISLTYLGKKELIKLNYSRAAQYINLISNSISPFNNLEVWLPASLNIAPQLADQVSLGWFRNSSKWSWSVESYYKWMTNQLDYANQARLLLNPHLEAELRAGKGWAYGIETRLVQNTGKLTGWLAYTYSRSFRQIPGINDGRTYVSLWDRPHQVAMNFNWASSDRVKISSTLYLSSGSPVTSPTSFYQFSGRTVPIYSSKNNDRLPVYHRYDVSFNWRLNRTERRFSHFLTISLYNFYAQKNTILESFNKVQVNDNTFEVPTNLNDERDIRATRWFVYGIVPSITYSFKI